MGASELARIAGGAPTSVMSSLRLLMAHGLVSRASSRYAFIQDHPAALELVALGLRLAPPIGATRLVVRAGDAVDFAIADEAGLVVGIRPSASADSLARLEGSLATIQRDRPDAPVVLRLRIDELSRLLHSALGLRQRVLTGELLKGVVRPAGPIVPASSGRGPDQAD